MDSSTSRLSLADARRLAWPAGLDYSTARNSTIIVLCESEPSTAQCRAMVVGADGNVLQLVQAMDLRQPRCHPDQPLLAIVQDDALLIVSLADGVPLHGTEEGPQYVDSHAWIANSTDLIVAGRSDQGQSLGLYLVSMRSASVTQLLSGSRDCLDVAVDPRGRYVAYVAREIGSPADVASSQLCLYDLDQATTRQVPLPYAAVSQPTWDPTGRFIAFIGRPLGPGHWSTNHEVAIVAAHSPDIAARRVSAPDCNAARRVPGARTLAWHGDSLLYVAPERGRLRIWRADNTDQAVPVPLDPERADGHVLDFCLGDAGVLYWDVWLDRLAALHRLPIGHTKQALDLEDSTVVYDPHNRLSNSRSRPQVSRLRTQAPDGTIMESFVVQDSVRRDGPVLIDMHGGPHGLHPNPSLPSLTLPWLLSGLGWTVLMPNPRGSTSYGMAFQESVVGDWAGGDFADIGALLDNCRATRQSRAIYLMGWSYGGYLAAFLTCRRTDVAGAVIGSPMTDLRRMESTTDVPDYCHHELGGLPSEQASHYESRSPITHVRDGMPGMLLLHTMDDQRCPVDQSTAFADAVRGRGGLVTVRVFDGNDHLLSTPKYRLVRLTETYTWLIVHAATGGPALPSRLDVVHTSEVAE